MEQNLEIWIPVCLSIFYAEAKTYFSRQKPWHLPTTIAKFNGWLSLGNIKDILVISDNFLGRNKQISIELQSFRKYLSQTVHCKTADEWHKNDIRVHRSVIRMTYEYIRVTYGWHMRAYEWHTDGIRVHTSGILMTYERVHTVDIWMTYECIWVTYGKYASTCEKP